MVVSVLVIDAGTSNLRVAEVSEEGKILNRLTAPSPLDKPVEGLAELDAQLLADTALEMAADVLAETHRAGRKAQAIGITNQRATTILWDKNSGQPVAPALSWQDLRTLGDCLALQSDGFRLAPNESATKLAWLLREVGGQAKDNSNLCFGTLDTWLIWKLTQGACHVTDHSNAGVTGLMLTDASGWDLATADHLEIPSEVLPQIVPSVGVVGEATALPGDIPIAALLGDQQSSLAGLGCLTAGTGKATFGTGANVNICLGDRRVEFERRGEHGTFPIVCRTQQSKEAEAQVSNSGTSNTPTTEKANDTIAITWGVEALDLSAGTNIAWLGDEWGLFSSPSDSELLAAACQDTEGVVFVPALEGLGAPQWDFGARGTFLGLTRGTEASHIIRAVLEGVAYRGAELLKAAEADGNIHLSSLRIDGGMSRNKVFAQALANATERPIEISSDTEGTSLGAGYLAGYATGIWSSLKEVSHLWQPADILEPTAPSNWDRWQEAVSQSLRWEEGLSEISF